MSEAEELFNPGKHPKVHPEILGSFVRANMAHPQMYGGMILRAGRVAYDLMMDGKISVSNFSRSLPDTKQIADLGERAVKAHKHVGIDMPFMPHGGRDETENGFLTPVSMRGVYMRARRGILKTIHSYAVTTLGIQLDAPEEPTAERVFMAKKLLGRDNRGAALVLQRMWQTADGAAQGRPIAESTAALHRALSSLQQTPNERAAQLALATRSARATFDSLIIPALQPLKAEAAVTLGDIAAADAVDTFSLDVIHEGNEEFSDEYIDRVRQYGHEVAGLALYDE